ncbi:monovalent cation/H+ antiporter subunit D [Clostridiales bacterium PH28_bin88]|nr:monovalent cation/H+ antiporter subunit D [Clostridiales bacterium PH28_bin88]
MNNNIIVFPVVLPMVTGIVLLFFYKHVRIQKFIAGLSVLAMMALALRILYLALNGPILVLRVGDFPAPFSIVLTVDIFGAIMLSLSGLISLVALFFSFGSIDPGREKSFYYAFWQIQMMGINGAFVTGDIFNLFVFFEILLISSYILLVLGGEPIQLREGLKYVLLNMMSGVFFLLAVGVLYSITGTLNMADLAVKVAEAPQKGLLTAVAMTFFVVFGMKGGLFPMYFWLPRSYFVAPSAVAALFGGMLTKVGIYATIRVFTLIFTYDPGFTHNIILWISGFTMFLGVLGALSQMDYKRILSYHIISQVGYMVMGLGLYTPLAIAGAIYYIVHHIIVKSCLFLVSGVTEKITGTTELKRMGGMLGTHPIVAYLFLIAGISLAGVPPFSGFFSKFVLMQAGLAEGRYGIVFVAIVVSFLTLFSMMKIFRYVYWGRIPEDNPPVHGSGYFVLVPPVLVLIALTVFLGLNAQWIMNIALAASEQLMNPEHYIQAVLIQ